MKNHRQLYNRACFYFIFGITAALAGIGFYRDALAADSNKSQLTLEQAVVCENIEDLKPVNSAITFSITIGKVICFTEFGEVSADTFVFHRWYRRDEMVTEKKLGLKPPRWSTYSSIQLRESDIGPWRIEIVNSDEQILDILRFSVTE